MRTSLKDLSPEEKAETEEIRLLPCPFCGEEMTLDRIIRKGELFEVVCRSCLASGPMSLYPKQACRGWNNRHKT